MRSTAWSERFRAIRVGVPTSQFDPPPPLRVNGYTPRIQVPCDGRRTPGHPHAEFYPRTRTEISRRTPTRIARYERTGRGSPAVPTLGRSPDRGGHPTPSPLPCPWGASPVRSERFGRGGRATGPGPGPGPGAGAGAGERGRGRARARASAGAGERGRGRGRARARASACERVRACRKRKAPRVLVGAPSGLSGLRAYSAMSQEIRTGLRRLSSGYRSPEPG